MDYETHYAQEEASDARHGKFQVYRFYGTAQHIPKDARSLVDVGCGEAHWLEWLKTHHTMSNLVGVEVAENRAKAAQKRYPSLDIRAGNVFEMNLEGSFEIVTCLEVIEHLEDWKDAVRNLLKIATRKVIITVPYREQIPEEICIHCHKPTPRYGHLHSFDESSFDEFKQDYPVTTDVIWGEDEGLWLRHAYYRTVAPPSWMVAVIHVDGELPKERSIPRAILSKIKSRAVGFIPRSILR